MIYDCFSYLDEDLLLDLRLNILDKIVDYFVIVEGNKTWQNNFKKLSFDKNKFLKFKDKIIYIEVNDLPDGDNPYLRENFQRNAILRGLKGINENDMVIISDLDEIPNPQAIMKFKKEMRYAVLEQKHFYYKFNLQSKNFPLWYGSRICLFKYLKSPQWLRDLKFKKRPFWRIDKLRLNNILENGGWHFCNLKSPKKLLYKYKNVCETNDQFIFKNKIPKKYLNESKIKKNIKKKLTIIGRNEQFNAKKLDNSFPSYLIKNKKFYSKWII